MTEKKWFSVCFLHNCSLGCYYLRKNWHENSHAHSPCEKILDQNWLNVDGTSLLQDFFFDWVRYCWTEAGPNECKNYNILNHWHTLFTFGEPLSLPERSLTLVPLLILNATISLMLCFINGKARISATIGRFVGWLERRETHQFIEIMKQRKQIPWSKADVLRVFSSGQNKLLELEGIFHA